MSDTLTADVLPFTSAAQETWALPAETATVLRDIDTACGALLRELGDLEIDYLNRKQRLMGQIQSRRDQFQTLTVDAAKKNGLDTEKQRWELDAKNMQLIRVR